MKKIVNVKPKIADTYNQLADYVNNKETVIYIKYDSKVYSSKLSLDKKSNERCKTAGNVLLALGLLAPSAFILGVPAAIISRLSDDFRCYKMIDNKDKKRLELYCCECTMKTK